MSPNYSQKYLGSRVEDLPTPAVVLDLDVMEGNLDGMQRFANEHGKNLRPHAKAHKSSDIARMQLERGAKGLTFAKASEADAVTAGLRDMSMDVFIANEVVQQTALETLERVRKRATNLRVAVDSEPGVDILAGHFTDGKNPLEVMMEIDSGLKRAGVKPGSPEVLKIAERIAKSGGLKLKGVFTHAGHAYGAPNQERLREIAGEEANSVLEAADVLRNGGYDVEVVSVGSTPTVKLSGVYDGVNEVRPGAYFANDRMQRDLRACDEKDIAISVLSRVTSKYKSEGAGDQSRVIADAGSKVYSSDKGAHGIEGLQGYAEVKGTGDIVTRLSEEHTELDGVMDVDSYTIGQMLETVPNHVCTVMNLREVVFGVRNGIVERVFKIAGRGQVV